MIGIIQFLEETRFLDIKLLNSEDFATLLFRYAINFILTLIVVKGLYYPSRKDKDYQFTFIIFNSLVFFICYLLSGIKLEIGFAFGIFALFSILRYRTITLPVVEMTYLFSIISIGVINALSNKKVSYVELIFTNLAIVGLIYYLEKFRSRNLLNYQYVTYEIIDHIKPEQHHLLKAEIEKRIGMEIEKFEIDRVNFMNDTARIKVFFQPSKSNNFSQELNT